MKELLLLKSENEISDFFKLDLSFDIEEFLKLKIEQCLDIFFALKYNDYMNYCRNGEDAEAFKILKLLTSPIANTGVISETSPKRDFTTLEEALFIDDEFKNSVKKDILCLIKLTCDYWIAEHEAQKAEWGKETYENFGKIEWRFDPEIKSEEGKIVLKSKKYLCNLKQNMLDFPEIWNKRKPYTNKNLNPQRMFEQCGKNLTSEEEYVFLYMTGMPIALKLYEIEDFFETEQIETAIKNICKIDAVNVRQYFANEIISKKENILFKYYNGQTINDKIILYSKIILKILICVCNKNLNPQLEDENWAINVSNRINKEYNLISSEERKKFWLYQDTKAKANSVSIEILGDTRNKANLKYVRLQEKIMEEINSNISSTTAARNIEIEPEFNGTIITALPKENK